jgi:hypothetical protein
MSERIHPRHAQAIAAERADNDRMRARHRELMAARNRADRSPSGSMASRRAGVELMRAQRRTIERTP